jgi:hypothetical protein
MPVKAPVFGRNDCVMEKWTHLARIDHAAELLATPRKDLAVSVQKRDRPARATVNKRCRLRHLQCLICNRRAKNKR